MRSRYSRLCKKSKISIVEVSIQWDSLLTDQKKTSLLRSDRVIWLCKKNIKKLNIQSHSFRSLHDTTEDDDDEEEWDETTVDGLKTKHNRMREK